MCLNHWWIFVIERPAVVAVVTPVLSTLALLLRPTDRYTSLSKQFEVLAWELKGSSDPAAPMRLIAHLQIDKAFHHQLAALLGFLHYCRENGLLVPSTLKVVRLWTAV